MFFERECGFEGLHMTRMLSRLPLNWFMSGRTCGLGGSRGQCTPVNCLRHACVGARCGPLVPCECSMPKLHKFMSGSVS
jgi:hypothetical protein